VFTFSFHLKK